MAHIYSLSFHESSWTRYDTSLLSFVSKERRNKILNYHFDIDKKLSLYAALLTRMEICNWTGILVLNHKKSLYLFLCLKFISIFHIHVILYF
mgnify:CR=1 FL=1